MPSLQCLAVAASTHSTCPADSPLSCSAGSSDTCCYEGTNGLFLQTQFWDYNPATGPSDSFTIHGLWSDKCSGGYNQFCNPSWEVSDVKGTLQNLGLTDLLNTMNTYWKNYDGSDEELWEHEFNKHGTCMSTVNPDCYPSSAPSTQYVGDFFSRVVSLWKNLPTYQWLTEAGITPDASTTHNVADIASVLESKFGASVYLGCDKSNNLQEVWYFYNLKGSVAAGNFIATDSISRSTCKDGLKWVPKGSSSDPGNSDPGNNNPGSNTGSSTKGYLEVDGQSGCLISNGKWYSSGTCATFTTASTVGGVSVTSSKGPCNVVNGEFTCGSDVDAGDFELSGSDLSYGGSTDWSASSTASGDQQVSVESGSGSTTFKLKFSPK